MHLRRTALAAGVFLAALGGLAWGAGYWSTLPIVGGSSFCAAVVGSGPTQLGQTGQGAGTPATGGPATYCAQTVPAGPPALTGNELIPADTGLAGGAPPQTVVIPSGALASAPNRIFGGDFGTNLWQRGTTPLNAVSANSAPMGADRWYVYAATNDVTVIKETGAADTVPAVGLYASMRVGRPNGTDNSQICTGQVLDKQAAASFIGNNAILSFWELAGAGLAAVDTNNALAVTIAYYTAGDSATPGTNTGTFSLGTITGYQAVAAVSPFTPTGVAASGVVTIPTSTTWTKYAVYAPIPATNAAGTAVTGIGFSICYTPASGTGGSTEWFELAGVDLVSRSSAITSPVPTPRYTPDFEAANQLWYSFVLTDGAATRRYAMCQATTTALAQCVLAFPEQMREIPTLTVGTTVSFAVTGSAGGALACGTSIGNIATSNTIDTAGLLCTTGSVSLVAGNASQLIGAATGGLLTFSAEP